MLKSNLLSGKTVQCKLCNVKAGHETSTKSRWGGTLPDKFDLYLKSRWDSIKSRCEDPTSKNYRRYGGRGIRLSDEFQDPRVFVAYVKSLPNASPDLEIDRRDNSRGYERGNLRWVDRKTNTNNRDVTLRVIFNGVEMPLTDFVTKHTDLSYSYVRELLRRGESTETIANWEREENYCVTYGGSEMTLRQFALAYTKFSYTWVRKLYLQGKTPEEIVAWKPKETVVTYAGMDMTFADFVKKYTPLSERYALKLYKEKGKSLDEIVNWKKRYPSVFYKDEEMSFPYFVKNYTTISYPYAVALRRKGKSLEEIASWKRSRACV